jgi:hypothetical protein
MKCAFSLLPGCVLILNLTFLDAAAQSGSPDMTFGAVLPEAFAPVVYDLDSNANAIYLFDHGEVSFDARYSTYGFSIVYERHARIRILNKNGLGLATMGLSTSHHKGYDAYIDDLRGATYNLQDGKVVVTKLDKSNIFKDKNGFYNIEKLAFPDVREGSIIEYSYRVVYPGFGYIPDWEFQQSYPVRLFCQDPGASPLYCRYGAFFVGFLRGEPQWLQARDLERENDPPYLGTPGCYGHGKKRTLYHYLA